MELHNDLKSLRTRQNLTQKGLADAIGITRQTIIAIEKGHFVPSVKLALQLARRLGVPLEELFWIEKDLGDDHA